jgi:putative ribosome biogenesis GTPase RsgA
VKIVIEASESMRRRQKTEFSEINRLLKPCTVEDCLHKKEYGQHDQDAASPFPLLFGADKPEK